MSKPSSDKNLYEAYGEAVDALREMCDNLTNLTQDLRDYEFQINLAKRQQAEENASVLIDKVKSKG